MPFILSVITNTDIAGLLCSSIVVHRSTDEIDQVGTEPNFSMIMRHYKSSLINFTFARSSVIVRVRVALTDSEMTSIQVAETAVTATLLFRTTLTRTIELYELSTVTPGFKPLTNLFVLKLFSKDGLKSFGVY